MEYIGLAVVILLVLLVTSSFIGAQIYTFAEATYGRIVTGF